jgi:hypothetical protein
MLQAAEMVSDLKAAFHDLLTENQWMDATTRHAAMQKADAILVLQGFPSWCDSSAQVDEFYNKVLVASGFRRIFVWPVSYCSTHLIIDTAIATGFGAAKFEVLPQHLRGGTEEER